MKKNSKVVTSFEEAQAQALRTTKKQVKETLVKIFTQADESKFIGLFRRDTFEFPYQWEFNGQKGNDIAQVKILITDLVQDENFHESMLLAFESCQNLGIERGTNKGNKISTQKEQEYLPLFKKALQSAFTFLSNSISIYNANIALSERVYQLIWKVTKEGNTCKGYNSFIKAVQAQLTAIQFERDTKNGFYNKKEEVQEILCLPENIQSVEVEEVETEQEEVIDYTKFTVKELKSMLDEKCIEYDKKAVKAILIQLLAA